MFTRGSWGLQLPQFLIYFEHGGDFPSFFVNVYQRVTFLKAIPDEILEADILDCKRSAMVSPSTKFGEMGVS